MRGGWRSRIPLVATLVATLARPRVLMSYNADMSATATVQIASLLVTRPGYRSGRPCLRGTGITVHSVAAAHLLGATTEQMCASNPDLDPSLFHAALAHYFANRAQVEAELDADRCEGERLAVLFPDGITDENFTEA